jgi:hypothetical protein
MPLSGTESTVPAARQSSKRQESSRFSSWAGSPSSETSIAKWAMPSRKPRKMGGTLMPSRCTSLDLSQPSSGRSPHSSTFSLAKGR